MIAYTEFDPQTSKITSFGLMQKTVFTEKTNIIEGAYDDTLFYIKDMKPVARPELLPSTLEILADGIEEVALSGLPDIFLITIDEEPYTIVGGSFTFSTILPGVYTLEAKTFPYKEKPIKIVAL